MLVSLSSPFIVSMYGVCEINSRFHLVMELLTQGSLFDHLLNEDEVITWTRRLQVSRDILLGVKFLHSQKPNQVIHRDLKALNVLLTENWKAKITDFGLAMVKKEITSSAREQPAKRKKEDKKASSSINGGKGNRNKRGELVEEAASGGGEGGRGAGSLPWMAPELFHRRPDFSTASDIYATGLVFYEIAARTLPFADAADAMIIPAWIQAGERPLFPDCTTGPSSSSSSTGPSCGGNKKGGGRNGGEGRGGEGKRGVEEDQQIPAGYKALIVHMWQQKAEARPTINECLTQLETVQKNYQQDLLERDLANC